MGKTNRLVRYLPRLKVNALFVKIWLYFLSLLIPTLIIGLVFYANFVNKQKHEFAGKIALHLQTVANTVDIHLGTIQGVNQNLLVNETVNRLLIPNRDLTVQEKAELVKLVQAVNNSSSIINNLIDSLFVYVDGERIYTPSGAEALDLFFAKSYRYERYDANDWLAKLRSDQMIEILPLTGIDSSYGNPRKQVVPFVTTGLVRGNKAVVVANISAEMIRSVLLGNDMFPAARFLVTDAGGNVILNTAGLGSIAVEELKRNYTGMTEANKIAIDGESYATAFERSPIYGWHYYSIMPASEFNRQAAGVLKLIALICSSLLIIGFCLSFIFAYRIYNPIKKIRDVLLANEETEERHLTNAAGRNELMALGDGVHELFQANETYRSQLNSASLDKLEHAVLQLLRGNRIEDGQIIAALLSRHFGFHWDGYLVFTIYFEFKERFYRDIQDVDRFIILGKLKKLIAGLLREYVPVYAIEFDRQQFVCIANMNDSGEAASLKQALDNLMHTFEYDALFCKIHIGVGSRTAGLSAIGKSYNEAMTALHNRDQSLDFQVIDSLALEIEHRFYYSFADENKLLYHLKKGGPAGAEEAILDVLRSNEARNVSHRSMHMLLMEIYNTALRYAADRGIDDLELLTEEEHLLLSGITGQPADYEAKIRLILKMCRQVADYSTPPPDNKTNATVSSIIRYIEENYGNELYLEKIAQEVNVSSKYVSRMFKEKMGVNLTDYISMYRMTKAKELLLQTNISVNEVAERVGIFSRATFLRLFKKFEGVSPKEFRNRSS